MEIKCVDCGGKNPPSIISEKMYGIPFEKIYLAPIYEVYKDVIQAFFDGRNHFDDLDSWSRSDGVLVHMGKIWVSEHGHFETLTVEPMDGSQFEIAVRMPHGVGAWAPNPCHYKYSGYSINWHGVLSGFDTNDH